ncbi:MAG TPA: hypothetical protein VFX15_00160 [Actinomycetes bacterium]|nr:hypothetical protein [Actinomycetes bacterium]
MTEQLRRPGGDEPVPHPGSQAAIDAGCICPVLDNNHGKSPPWPPDGWWIVEGCPLHDRGRVR